MEPDLIIHDEAKTLAELQAQRMIRTHDAQGRPYSFGNRSARRFQLRRGHELGGKKKQLHKVGHK